VDTVDKQSTIEKEYYGLSSFTTILFTKKTLKGWNVFYFAFIFSTGLISEQIRRRKEGTMGRQGRSSPALSRMVIRAFFQ